MSLNQSVSFDLGAGEISPVSACQRWREGRSSYRPLREPIDTSKFEVLPINDGAARDFVIKHHYSKSYPAAVARYGLFSLSAFRQPELVGVAVFSVPIQPKAGPAYGGGLTPFCDLGRFVLLDEVGANAETYFLAAAKRMLAQDKVGADGRPLYGLVLAYSDPIPRTSSTGQVIHQGHVGQIYRASSAIYCGRASARTLWLAHDGSVLSERSLSKLRTSENGARAAYKRLVDLGAPRRALGETDRDYVARALIEGPFRRMRHPGNFVFAFPQGSHSTRKRLRTDMIQAADCHKNAA